MNRTPLTGSLDFSSRLELVTLLLVCLTAWELAHQYGGIEHDAVLYTLQALSYLQPDSVGRDVFVRLGAQDHYTLFSPLYALTLSWLGPDRAAACLALSSQLLFLGAAWWLARQLAPGSTALLGLVVLIAIPGFYGPHRVFRCIEPFLTARLPAEALVLLGIAATLHRRAIVGLACAAAAALLHPIMAAPGLLALLWMHRSALTRSLRRSRGACGLALAAAALLGLILLAYGGGFTSLDPEWLAVVRQRAPYLFLAFWTEDDWGRLLAPLATVLIGARVLAGARARDLCRFALLATGAGIALTLVCCDLLHWTLAVQAQPWRWEWLEVVWAALLLPAVVQAAWATAGAGRTVAVLLLCLWVFGASFFAVMTAGVLLLTLMSRARLTGPRERLTFIGACALLIIAASWRLASNLTFLDAYYIAPSVPLWARRLMSLCADGSVPAAVAALTCWAVSNGSRWVNASLTAAAAALCVGLLPPTWRSWTQGEFSPQVVAGMLAWRSIVPADAEVFWPEMPLGSWVLLERPHYLSVFQTSGVVFSRELALEAQRRAAALSPVIAPSWFLGWDTGQLLIPMSAEQLERACRTGQFSYLVTPARLHFPPVAALNREVWPVSGGLRLYRCQDGIPERPSA